MFLLVSYNISVCVCVFFCFYWANRHQSDIFDAAFKLFIKVIQMKNCRQRFFFIIILLVFSSHSYAHKHKHILFAHNISIYFLRYPLIVSISRRLLRFASPRRFSPSSSSSSSPTRIKHQSKSGKMFLCFVLAVVCVCLCISSKVIGLDTTTQSKMKIMF